jgi:hypothetical protein
MEPADQIRLAQACIADSLHPENDAGMLLDAGLQALRYLGHDVESDPQLGRYLAHRYDPQHRGYAGTHEYVLARAKVLIAKMGAE